MPVSHLALGIAILFTTISPAFAYADPGAGGMVFQLLTPALAFGAAGFAILRKKMLSLRASVVKLCKTGTPQKNAE